MSAAVLGDEAGSTWTTSGALGLIGVGSELGVRLSTKESAGLVWLAKIWAYWPSAVSPSPICGVVVPVVLQGPRMALRWPQQSVDEAEAHNRLVPP